MAATEMLTPPIIRTKKLTVEELQTLQLPLKIAENIVTIEKGLRDCKLGQPVTIALEKILEAKEKGLVLFIVTALLSERPQLIPFVFDNQSVIKMARHFLRHCSGSHHSCSTYIVNIKKYSTWLGYSPDIIIKDIFPIGSIPDQQRIQNHNGYLNDYLAVLQDDGLTPGAVCNYIKAVKTFYRVNGAKIELLESLSRRVTYKDRAPQPKDLSSVLDFSDEREKFIVAGFALGGFREATFSKLKYRHVKIDLEANRVPIHIHVEAEITKGKYHDYDTFLGPEAVQYLKNYLRLRRKGTKKLPPEEITPESPLIRDQRQGTPKDIGTKQIRKIVHSLYGEADLLKEPVGRLYDIRVHSLRKYFKTQLLALGVQGEYVEYMMGHTIDTYNDIQSLGIEKLRSIYQAANLSIKTKTQVSKIDALKEIIRAWGMNPEQLLAKDALEDGAITVDNLEEYQNHQLAVLTSQLKELIKKEVAV
jgi:hypothetical protein